MLLSAVSVSVVAQSSSEIPEGLMNNPVLTQLPNYFPTFHGLLTFLHSEKQLCWVITKHNNPAPSLLYNGYRVFPGGEERLGRDADPSTPSSAVVKKG